jgi:hypothetical protein
VSRLNALQSGLQAQMLKHEVLNRLIRDTVQECGEQYEPGDGRLAPMASMLLRGANLLALAQKPNGDLDINTQVAIEIVADGGFEALEEVVL